MTFKMEMIKETRKSNGNVAVEGRHVSGYAIVFNQWSEDLGGFREMIKPEALDGVLERSDVFALLNHDNSRGILARCKAGKENNSLQLTIDERGLKYDFEAPNTTLGNELLSYLERGEIDGSSFAFTCRKCDWEDNEDGSVTRTITAFDEIFDVSPVFTPAYSQTTCDMRGLQEMRDAKAAEAAAAEEQRQRDEEAAKEQADYIAQLKAQIDNE